MNGVQISKMGKSGLTKPGAMKGGLPGGFPGGFPGGNPKSMEAAMAQLQQMQGGGGSNAQKDMLKMFQQMSKR